MDLLETGNAKTTDEISIARQTVGDDPIDILCISRTTALVNTDRGGYWTAGAHIAWWFGERARGSVRLDLDGVVADFYGTIRPLAAEWLGKPLDDLTESPTYGLHEWGFNGSGAEYQKFHRWAVVQRRLFSSLAPIPGAAPALRRLSDDKVRIRIITNRLFIPHFHAPAVASDGRVAGCPWRPLLGTLSHAGQDPSAPRS